MARYCQLTTLLSILLLATPSIVFATPTCSLAPPTAAALAAAQPSTTNIPSSNPDAPQEILATAWYPAWLGNSFPPSNISWSKYTAMTFAFAITTPDTSKLSMDDTSAAVLPDFVAEARKNNVAASVSIGGWTGSIYFSPAVATPENRTIFVKTITDFATANQLDGIDFDWEYPGKQGIGCNAISPQDSANFLSFLQELKQDPVGSKLTLSAAVGITPFMGPDNTPMTDVSAFADVLDHIAIMNYDIWGSWSTGVGPNAPLDDSCAPTKAGSAVSAVKAWTDAKFPANKIALGVAAYGHSFQVDPSAALDSSGNLASYPAFNKANQPLGDSDISSAPTTDQCGNSVGPSGVFNFWGLISNGFLKSDGTPADGIVSSFDDCSQTPFVYNKTSEVMVSYDDAKSFAAKGEFISNQGLMGFAMWHVAGDSNDILVDAISDAIGIEDCS